MSHEIRIVDYYRNNLLSTNWPRKPALPAQQNHCCRGHSFTLSFPAKFSVVVALILIRSGSKPQSFATFSRIRGIMPRQFRLLRHQSDIGIDQLKTLTPHDLQRLGQKFAAGDVFVTWIAVGKMRANIAFTQCAENGVDQRMQHRIGVGMAQQAPLVKESHAAQNELSPAAKSVHIEAMSDAKIRAIFCRNLNRLAPLETCLE